MMRAYWMLLAVVAVLATRASAAQPDTCTARFNIKQSDDYRVVVSGGPPVRQLSPAFFGFNLEWLEFQLSLWDAEKRQVRPDVIALLKPFAGAVYRFPGGTVSNHYDWRDGVGPLGERPVKTQASWAKPLPVQFGFREYLQFLSQVEGQGWYVANLYGNHQGTEPLAKLSASAAELAALASFEDAAGLPAIMRWELGNELDRDRYRWMPQRFGEAAKALRAAIRNADPDAKFVSLLEEYPAMERAGYTASSYNRALLKELKPVGQDFAMHLYYDGKPGGPPIPKQLGAVCRAVEDARTTGVAQPNIWVTEHARVPEGAWATPDWKSLWPETANLQAAISVADFVIAAAQMPEIQGAMIHTLHGTDGPWPLLHKTRAGDKVHPSTVLLALRMLRESMLPEVLSSKVESANASGYAGGYDMRAVVMTDAKRQRYTVWAANREGHPLDLVLNIAALKGQKLPGSQTTLTDENLKANNYLSSERVQPSQKELEIFFEQAGTAHILISPNSVTSIKFSTNQE